MPALKLFGRKWLAATDDLVYPGLFELFIRIVWLILIGIACVRYYEDTWNCRLGGELVRVYLLGEAVMLSIVTLLILIIIRHSARGTIMDTHARRYVEPLLIIKISMLLPEIGWNVLGTMWIFGQSVECSHASYSITVVEALVFFDWILIGLSIFGLALVFDPIGSLERRQLESSVEHGKISRIWLRRFKFLWWMRKDESASETFQHVADHKTASIVVTIRGSLSLRDLITDIAAASDSFDCPGVPPDSTAHKGMIIGVKVILKQLENYKVLERAFATYPNYHLTITGHSLGAGLAILLGLLIRPRYPDLRVYAFATPAGLLSRDAARITEEFALTIGLGDDLVMRLSVDSIENLRTSLLATLRACRLPKYRVVLNGFGYALFGVPENDLSKTWTNYNIISTIPGQSPLLAKSNDADNKIIERDITKRRYSKEQLFNAGRILHITRCKLEKTEGKRKKQLAKERKYEMRWAQAEEFTKLSVMPRMLLDHLPENIELALATLLEQQNDIPYYFDP